MSDKLVNAMNIVRRMPVDQTDETVQRLAVIQPELEEDLREKVDVPLEVREDPEAGKSYLCCEYNRDGDSFRSPWTNTYYPPIEVMEGEDEPYVSEGSIREMESRGNELFQYYSRLYYGGANTVTSTYFWDTDPGVGACWLLKKCIPRSEGGRHVQAATWDTIHLFEAVPPALDSSAGAGGDSSWTYRLTTTLIVSMDIENAEVGTVHLTGSLNRQVEKPVPVPAGEEPDHVAAMGEMVEHMETDLRESLDTLYLSKVTKDVVNSARQRQSGAKAAHAGFVQSLNAAVLRHGSKHEQ